ncbi:hypothetical protein ACGFI4_29180 [Micromonospora carbonacea]|uniref:Sulfotransferase family protein n=1 Tax=Micromonospora carbonacea TaxID=47853 RepID=A0A1C5ARJ0_9ACTN|nr:hypothetical protein [Micromonospora carbonacea]MBB5828535.1 hypothetical protein [Micromonospora carbonacea]QLD23866.1 hypothetical protein HXZ27_06295 [Micromonospora carbonacea]SCF47800.1 hypothetical protein GA0070563_11736 [Micromonospora carbonacea]
MARRVFLHVGAPKTGSTFVQDVLWRNRRELKRAGILLPGSARAQDAAMTDLRQVPWRDADLRWTWDRLAAKARGWPGDVIISNEGLGGASSVQAARAVESLLPAEVHIVVAGRDLWRTLPSTWQQSIRARSGWRFGAFLGAVERGEFDTFWENYTANRMLRRWGDLVPAERRHLVTVPPPGAPHDTLWHRFAGIMGIPDGLCELAAPTSNPSLGAAEAEVLRRVNLALGDRYPLRRPYQEVVQRHLVDSVLRQRGNGLRFGVGLDRAAWVADQAERQITELRDYPCQVAGDLAELRPTGMTQSRSPDELDDGQVLTTAIETIVAMLEQAEALSTRADRRYEEILARVRTRVDGGVRRRLRRAGRR